MDLATCLKKMELVGVLAFATVDSGGAPQIRNISAIHYEPDALYFFTARGKNFCKELMEDGRVQMLCYTKYKEMTSQDREYLDRNYEPTFVIGLGESKVYKYNPPIPPDISSELRSLYDKPSTFTYRFYAKRR